ncbi:immunity 8 family protein [Paraburkholderia graminis]
MRAKFGTWIRLFVGPPGVPGADTFDVFVCTPDWLSEKVEDDSAAQWGRHLLIVKEYDLGAVVRAIEEMIGRISAADWPAVAVKLSRYAAWEFEDYKMEA